MLFGDKYKSLHHKLTTKMKLMEKMYRSLILLAVRLKNEGRTMTCSEVVDWINANFTFSHPYASVRGVFQAAHNRAQTQSEINALESVFTDKDGYQLL